MGCGGSKAERINTAPVLIAGHTTTTTSTATREETSPSNPRHQVDGKIIDDQTSTEDREETQNPGHCGGRSHRASH